MCPSLTMDKYFWLLCKELLPCMECLPERTEGGYYDLEQRRRRGGHGRFLQFKAVPSTVIFNAPVFTPLQQVFRGLEQVSVT